MLKIDNLHASIGGNEILNGITLSVNAGEVHAIMGPNGSGKSTLAQVLAGRDTYEVTKGSVLYNGKDLLDMDPEERAREGVFLAFQYPVHAMDAGYPDVAARIGAVSPPPAPSRRKPKGSYL